MLIAVSDTHSVVFSYWTYTLNLVQAMLADSGIKYTRIDGKTTLPKRTEAVQSFQADPSLRVILVSITCGGAGYVDYSLTVVSLLTYADLISLPRLEHTC
jgi:hypothetical protein